MASAVLGQTISVNVSAGDIVFIDGGGIGKVNVYAGSKQVAQHDISGSYKDISIIQDGTVGIYLESGAFSYFINNPGQSADQMTRSQRKVADGLIATGLGNIYGPDGLSIVSNRIFNKQKIQRMFARLGQSSYRRCVIGYHGMSIVSGVGTNDVISSYTENFRLRSMAAVIGKVLNTQFSNGGAWAPGADIFISGFETVAGGAAFTTAYGNVGPNGRGVSLGAGTVSIPVTAGRAGQVVRLLVLAVPTVNPTDPVTARYSLSGANTQATTNATASTGTPVAAIGNAHYYEFSITLANAGDTTVTIAQPTTGGTIIPYLVDMDYRTDAGVTVHRLAYTGTGITECCAWALDATDVQPAGNWTTVSTPLRQSQVRDTQTVSMLQRISATNGGANVPLDAAICSFDVNDIVKSTTFGYTLADHKRHIQNYVNKMTELGIPVLFVCGNMRDPSTISAIGMTQLDIIQMYKDVSDASSDICGAAFLDLTTEIYGTDPTQKYNAQWRDPLFQIASEAPSYLHPTAFGHARLGGTIASSIINAATLA